MSDLKLIPVGTEIKPETPGNVLGYFDTPDGRIGPFRCHMTEEEMAAELSAYAENDGWDMAELRKRFPGVPDIVVIHEAMHNGIISVHPKNELPALDYEPMQEPIYGPSPLQAAWDIVEVQRRYGRISVHPQITAISVHPENQ